MCFLQAHCQSNIVQPALNINGENSNNIKLRINRKNNSTHDRYSYFIFILCFNNGVKVKATFNICTEFLIFLTSNLDRITLKNTSIHDWLKYYLLNNCYLSLGSSGFYVDDVFFGGGINAF